MTFREEPLARVSLPLKSYADLPQAAGADIGGHERPAIRGTGLLEYPADGSGSLRLDASRLHHLGPLLGFG
jgi:hypothetical protein